MIIRDITYYLQGRLSESQSMKLWEVLIMEEEAFSIFETHMMLREYYSDPDITKLI